MSEPVAATTSAGGQSNVRGEEIKVDEDAVQVEGQGKSWQVKYYLPSSTAAPSRAVDLPDSYYSPSAVELQAAFAGQVKKREQLTDGPLLTKRLREREEAEKNRAKAAKWPQTRIRVRFADRSQLESVFESGKHTMTDVYACVRAALRDDAAQDDFTLYQTPPKKDYKATDPNVKGKSLMQLQLTPSSVFYIRFSAAGIDNPPPLKAQVLEKATELPMPPAVPVEEPTTDDKKGKGAMGGARTLGFGGDKGKVIPKWMKLGGPTK